MRIISFCADGIEQAASRGFFDWAVEQDAEIICIQNLLAQEYDLKDPVYYPENYYPYFFDSPKKGTNGVAIYCRHVPKAIMTGLGMPDSDHEARYIQADYESLSIASLLLPQAPAGDQDALNHKFEFMQHFQHHLDKVRNKRRNFILCGNWGIAHQDIDVAKPELWTGMPGFLPDEQRWMDSLLNHTNYVDAFRQVNLDDDEFTWWPDGEPENGLRVDYQVISSELKSQVEYGAVYKTQSFSSHAPLIMDYDMELG